MKHILYLYMTHSRLTKVVRENAEAVIIDFDGRERPDTELRVFLNITKIHLKKNVNNKNYCGRLLVKARIKLSFIVILT